MLSSSPEVALLNRAEDDPASDKTGCCKGGCSMIFRFLRFSAPLSLLAPLLPPPLPSLLLTASLSVLSDTTLEESFPPPDCWWWSLFFELPRTTSESRTCSRLFLRCSFFFAFVFKSAGSLGAEEEEETTGFMEDEEESSTGPLSKSLDFDSALEPCLFWFFSSDSKYASSLH